MKRMVLFVNGPLRGRLAECDRPPMYMPEDGLHAGEFPFTLEPLEPKQYYFHQIALFGHIIWLGSVDVNSPVSDSSAAKDDLWELLISSAAKQAARP